MEELYVTERQFARIAKGAKNIVNYPNPIVKVADGVRYNIVKKGTKAEISKLPEKDKYWYLCKPISEEVVRIEVKGWFPTELVCGVARRTFSSETKLAQKTGCLTSYMTGTSGSANMFFLASKVDEAIKILKKNHFEIVDYR